MSGLTYVLAFFWIAPAVGLVLGLLISVGQVGLAQFTGVPWFWSAFVALSFTAALVAAVAHVLGDRTILGRTMLTLVGAAFGILGYGILHASSSSLDAAAVNLDNELVTAEAEIQVALDKAGRYALVAAGLLVPAAQTIFAAVAGFAAARNRLARPRSSGSNAQSTPTRTPPST